MDRKLEPLAQLSRKFSYFLRQRTFLSAHAQRIAQHDLAHLILADGALQPAKISAFVLALQRLQPLGSDAERVGDSKAHAASAIVDGQDASGEAHTAIIRGSASYLEHGHQSHYSACARAAQSGREAR